MKKWENVIRYGLWDEKVYEEEMLRGKYHSEGTLY